MKDKKNYLIGGLFIAVVFMAIGYGALVQQLNINGTAAITSTWDIEITGITKVGTTGGASETSAASFTATTATFNVDLKAPGDSITYDVTIKNKGSLNAALKTLTLNPSTSATTGIKYTVTGVSTGTKLAASGTNTMKIKIEWVSSDTTVPTTKTKSFTATLNYEQDTNA